MFTGIVTDLGTILAVEERDANLRRLRIGTVYDPSSIALGASIACNGICLTAVGMGGEAGRGWFDVDAAAETLARTTLKDWKVGDRINLERALKIGDELGGHIVTGHVDAVGRVASREETGGSIQFWIATPQDLAPYVAPKGSITVDGVSLTVNAVEDEADGTCRFMLNIIPHTADVTTLGNLQADDPVNLEIDVLARYLQRMQALRG
jgi:riboflavin synthase